MEKITKPRYFFGWVVAIAGFFLQLAIGWSPNTFSVFLVPLQTAFGASRTRISVLAVWASLGYGASAYPGAWFTDKYGPRVPIILAATFAGVSLYFMSRASSLDMLSLLYVTSGLTGLTFAIGRSVVQRWFKKRRGLSLGLVTAGMGVGGFMYPTLLTWVIDRYSWQSGYLLMAILVPIIFFIAAFLMADHPEKIGQRPYGAEEVNNGSDTRGIKGNPTQKAMPIWTVKEALKTRALLLLLLVNFICTVPGFMINVHFVAFAEGIGISRAVAAATQGSRSLVGIVGSVVSGILAEILGWKRGLIIFTALSGLAILWLVITKNAGMLWAFAIVFGFVQSARAPLADGIVGTYYGTKFLTQLIALNLISMMFGTALGPIVGGLVYDRTGSYNIAFIAGAVLFGIATVAMLAIKQPQKKPDKTPAAV